MSDRTRRVLDMVASGKIGVDEAEALLRALEGAAADEALPKDATPTDEAGKARPRYLRIHVHKMPRDTAHKDQDVNIRVPLAIVRGGMRLGAIIPGLGERIASKARERGIDLDLSKIDGPQLDALLRDLSDTTIDIDEGRQQVRITCE
jgi:SHOCT-like protein